MDARKILAILNWRIWGKDFCKHEHEIAKTNLEIICACE